MNNHSCQEGPKPKRTVKKPVFKRAGIGKSLRFDVFNRDGFRCRYCGKTSEEVTLVIDHMIPVSKGGTNDEANLITSCDSCNAGKSAKLIGEKPDNENARLGMLQKAREQMAEAKAALAIAKADKKFRQLVIDEWCEITGRSTVDKGTISVVTGYARVHGIALIIEWINKAHWRCGHDDRKMGRYISGIRRHHEEEHNQ